MTKSSKLSHQGLNIFSWSVWDRVLIRAVPSAAMTLTELYCVMGDMWVTLTHCHTVTVLVQYQLRKPHGS